MDDETRMMGEGQNLTGDGVPVPPQVPPRISPEYGIPVPPQAQPGDGMPVPPQGQMGYGVPPVPPQMQVPYQTMPPYGYVGSSTVSSSLAIASMALGIVSIVLCAWYIIGLSCAIVGLVLGCVYRAKGGTNGMSIAGIACSSVGLALGLLMLFGMIIELL